MAGEEGSSLESSTDSSGCRPGGCAWLLIALLGCGMLVQAPGTFFGLAVVAGLYIAHQRGILRFGGWGWLATLPSKQRWGLVALAGAAAIGVASLDAPTEDGPRVAQQADRSEATEARATSTQRPVSSRGVSTETGGADPTSEPDDAATPSPRPSPLPPTDPPASETPTAVPATATQGPPSPTSAPTAAPVAAPVEAVSAVDVAAAPGIVQFRYVAYDGQVPRSEDDEYAEIINVGGSPVNLSGWRLNAGDPGQDFYFPAFDLAPGQSCRVYTNEFHLESCGFSFGRGAAIWHNDGDCGYLFDNSGQQVDDYCY